MKMKPFTAKTMPAGMKRTEKPGTITEDDLDAVIDSMTTIKQILPDIARSLALLSEAVQDLVIEYKKKRHTGDVKYNPTCTCPTCEAFRQSQINSFHRSLDDEVPF